jgi:hypothetical protein
VTNCFTPQEFAVKLFQDGLMSDPAMTPFKRLLNNFHKAGSLQEKKEIALKLCEDVSQLYFRRNEQELSRFQALSTLYFQMKLLLEPDVYLNTVHSVIDAYFDPLSNK